MCEQFPWFLDTIEEELQRGRTPPSTLTLEWLVSAVDSSTTPSRRVGGCLGHLLLTLPEQVHRLPQLLCASVGSSVSDELGRIPQLSTEVSVSQLQNLFGGLSMACDFADLVQNGFCTCPVAALQGSFGPRSCTSPAVSRRNIHPPNSF